MNSAITTECRSICIKFVVILVFQHISKTTKKKWKAAQITKLLFYTRHWLYSHVNVDIYGVKYNVVSSAKQCAQKIFRGKIWNLMMIIWRLWICPICLPWNRLFCCIQQNKNKWNCIFIAWWTWTLCMNDVFHYYFYFQRLHLIQLQSKHLHILNSSK